MIAGLLRLARAPLVHFLALGGLLVLGRTYWAGPLVDAPHVIQVTSEVLDLLAVEPANRRGEGIEPQALAAWVDEEILYREGMRRRLDWNPAAIARRAQFDQPAEVRNLGDDGDEPSGLAAARSSELDRADPVIRAQVAGKMRLLLRQQALVPPPADADLEAYLRAHAGQYARASRVSFTHVFVRRDRGPAARAEAEALWHRIHAEHLDLVSVVRHADVFRPGARFADHSRADVERVFGSAVADAVDTTAERQWSAPVESPYGWHLVWVEGRAPGMLPSLASVRTAVEVAWRDTRSRVVVEQELATLRSRYRIDVAPNVAARLTVSGG